MKRPTIRPSAVRELAPKDPGGRWNATRGRVPFVELAAEIGRNVPLILSCVSGFVTGFLKPRPKPQLSGYTRDNLIRISAELESLLEGIDPRTKLFGKIESFIDVLDRHC